MVNVKPLACASVNWNENFVVNAWILIGVFQNTLLASFKPPSVNCKRESFEALASPFSVNPAVDANPLAKLMVVPPAWITYAAVPISLFVRLGSMAIALMVSESATVIG